MESPYQLRYEPLADVDGLQVSRSPWGPDDVLGRLNWMTEESRASALAQVDGARVFDLSVPYEMGMPCWEEAGDPKYDIWMTHTPHGSVHDNLSGAGSNVHRVYSYAGSAISMYSHAGTHLCSLTHFGHHGMFWNGITPESHLASRNWMIGGDIPPIVNTAILLDVARTKGYDCLPDSYEITADDIRETEQAQNTPIETGDVVLVRTGRMSRWSDPQSFLRNPPGLGMSAARYLCESAGAMCIGVDAGGEAIPSSIPDSFLPVHCYLLATAGTPIFENMMLEEIAVERVHSLVLVAAPLRLKGSTGLPTRPLAFRRLTDKMMSKSPRPLSDPL